MPPQIIKLTVVQIDHLFVHILNQFIFVHILFVHFWQRGFPMHVDRIIFKSANFCIAFMFVTELQVLYVTYILFYSLIHSILNDASYVSVRHSCHELRENSGYVRYKQTVRTSRVFYKTVHFTFSPNVSHSYRLCANGDLFIQIVSKITITIDLV